MEYLDNQMTVEELAKAVADSTSEKKDYMKAWLDGWSCHKNAESKEEQMSDNGRYKND